MQNETQAHESESMLHGQTLQMSREMQECIENCMASHKSCEQLIIHCLMKGGAHADANHIRTLMDCSQICRVSADFMLRDSQLYHQVAEVCALACQACADDCRQMSDDNAMMACADICDRSAATCRAMREHH